MGCLISNIFNHDDFLEYQGCSCPDNSEINTIGKWMSIFQLQHIARGGFQAGHVL